MEILVKIGQLLLSLSILVVLHEFGHFLFARLFNTRVEKFYLFFNPWFSLFKKQIGETTYGIGWLPLGGYVKISGMIDESMDKEAMEQPPQPWEFRAKPAWQRLLIMIGGVLVNFLLAIVIYIMILFTWGEEYLPVAKMEHGIIPDSTAMLVGFKAGDRILSVDNQPVEQFNALATTILLNNAKTVQIERNHQKQDIVIPEWLISRVIKNNDILFTPRFPFLIGDFETAPRDPINGLQKGDILQAVDTFQTPYADLLSAALGNYKGQTIDVQVYRNGELITVKADVNEKGKLGIALDIAAVLPFSVKEYGLLESVPAGITKGFTTVSDYLKQLKLIFSPKTKAYESLGGFITIGKIFPGTWNWQSF
ncbi:MAG: RIP metalloprotease RseP, partial [Salinivirgaceae bacterium]|nr:RIP metalloprotease RseP [Salinivirgaceae bacterium]